jgi:phosphate:Na+ symporter
MLAQLSTATSPAHPELAGAARMAEEVPRQIANAHTIFNVANTMIFIWFTGAFARAVERLVPERIEPVKEIIAAKFLDSALLDTPTLALEATRFEGQRLAGITLDMMNGIGPALRSGEKSRLEDIEKLDGQVDVLKGKIMAYLGDIYTQELTQDESTRLLRQMRGIDEIQRISSVIRNDMLDIGHQIIDTDVEYSETTDHSLRKLYEQVCSAVALAVEAIGDRDESKALDVIQMKPTVNRLIEDALEFQQQRVAPAAPDLIAQFRIEGQVIDALKRVYSLSKRLANLMLPGTVAARDV